MVEIQNEKGQTVRKYQLFDGPEVYMMPRLLAQGRTLITPIELMMARLYGDEADKQYLNTYIVVNVAVIPNPNGGELKYVHKHPLIYGLNPNSRLEFGFLPVAMKDYNQYEGYVLSKSEVNEFINDPYGLPDKRREFLADGDADLARNYEQHVCETLESSFDKVMGFYMPLNRDIDFLNSLSMSFDGTPFGWCSSDGLRLLIIGSVCWSGRSFAHGGAYLEHSDGHLVGVVHDDAEKPVTMK